MLRRVVNLLGCLLTGFGVVLSAVHLMGHQVLVHAGTNPILFAQALPPTKGLGPEQMTSIGTVVLGISTLLINGYFSERKTRIEAASRLAEKQADSDARLVQVASAKVIADAEITRLRADIDALRAGKADRSVS